jgi:phosphoglycerate dehydrogenase-like enzyme
MAEPKYVILITDPLAQEGLSVFQAHPEFDVRVKTGLKGQALKDELAQAHALVVRSRVPRHDWNSRSRISSLKTA